MASAGSKLQTVDSAAWGSYSSLGLPVSSCVRIYIYIYIYILYIYLSLFPLPLFRGLLQPFTAALSLSHSLTIISSFPFFFPPTPFFAMPLLRNVLLCLLPLVPSVLSDSQCKPQPDRCKAVPGTPGWPSPQTWARLNESVSGRLLQPPPPGAVCHAGQPTYNEAACAAVRTAWTSYEFHTDHPISTVWNQWNNDTCLPWDGNPCSSQGYPVFVINATTVDHVKKGVDFGELPAAAVFSWLIDRS
jgi:hypothetical protein